MLHHLLQCSLISRTLNHPRNLHIVMLVTWNFHVYVYLIEFMINEVLWGTKYMRSQDFYFLIRNNVIDVILYKNQG